MEACSETGGAVPRTEAGPAPASQAEAGAATKGSSRGEGVGGRKGKGGHGARTFGGRGGGPGGRGSDSLRSSVLALRRAHDVRSAAPAVASLQAALLTLEESNAAVDGALVGMAAAQASRLALRELVDALCAFAWCRLTQCGGREVAELVSAAVKHNCGDEKFFHFVGAFCRECPSAFSSLRDVALLSASLLKRADPGSTPGPRLDCASAFHGLAVAAMPHLKRCDSGEGQLCVRDVAEFLYALAHVIDRKRGKGIEPLHKCPVCSEAITASVSVARRCLHRASPQDIAKLTGAVATVWPLLVKLQTPILQPFLTDLAQAVRFRHRDFNAKDVASTVVAFAKLDVVDDVVAEVLPEQVEARVSEFPDKDLSLLLWACSRPGWVGRRCAEAAVAELQKRDLSRMAVVDLCMAAQALAKLGPPAKAALCMAAGEAFNRQLYKFSTADKALLMWSLAKSRVVHLALCRLLIRSLAAECCSKLQRDIVSATLWATAVICPSLPAGEEWARKLVQDLCSARPWTGASPFEVANAAWAFGQLPLDWVSESWPPLMATAEKLSPGALALHELCNLLSGLGVCPTSVQGSQQLLEQVLCEVLNRARNGARISMHDKRSLNRMLAILGAEEDWPRLPGFEELALFVSGGEPGGRRASGDSAPGGWGASPDNASAWLAVPASSVAPGSWREPDLAPADQAAGFTRQPEGAAARPAPQAAGGGGAAQADGHGPDEGRAEASPPTMRPKALSFTLKDVHDTDLRSPDLTPRHPDLTTDADGKPHSKAELCHFVEDPSTMGHGSDRMTCQSQACCPSVDASGSGDMQLNAHCDFPGHCVQLRNTFIHVECNAVEEDCAICGIRQRARSVDTLAFRAATSPGRSCRSPGRSPALRPRADPDGTRSAGNSPAHSPAPLPPRQGGSRSSVGSGGSAGSGGALAFQ